MGLVIKRRDLVNPKEYFSFLLFSHGSSGSVERAGSARGARLRPRPPIAITRCSAGRRVMRVQVSDLSVKHEARVRVRGGYHDSQSMFERSSEHVRAGRSCPRPLKKPFRFRTVATLTPDALAALVEQSAGASPHRDGEPADLRLTSPAVKIRISPSTSNLKAPSAVMPAWVPMMSRSP